jgi:Cu+-exporting ATPase
MSDKTSDFFVEGMTCQACVRRVQRAIEGLGGVRSVQVDLAGGRVIVEHDEACEPDGVAQAIRRSGYQIAGMRAAT